MTWTCADRDCNALGVGLMPWVHHVLRRHGDDLGWYLALVLAAVTGAVTVVGIVDAAAGTMMP